MAESIFTNEELRSIATLVDLGAERDAALVALVASKWELNAAADSLLSQGVLEPHPEPRAGSAGPGATTLAQGSEPRVGSAGPGATTPAQGSETLGGYVVLSAPERGAQHRGYHRISQSELEDLLGAPRGHLAGRRGFENFRFQQVVSDEEAEDLWGRLRRGPMPWH